MVSLNRSTPALMGLVATVAGLGLIAGRQGARIASAAGEQPLTFSDGTAAWVSFSELSRADYMQESELLGETTSRCFGWEAFEGGELVTARCMGDRRYEYRREGPWALLYSPHIEWPILCLPVAHLPLSLTRASGRRGIIDSARSTYEAIEGSEEWHQIADAPPLGTPAGRWFLGQCRTEVYRAPVASEPGSGGEAPPMEHAFWFYPSNPPTLVGFRRTWADMGEEYCALLEWTPGETAALKDSTLPPEAKDVCLTLCPNIDLASNTLDLDIGSPPAPPTWEEYDRRKVIDAWDGLTNVGFKAVALPDALEPDWGVLVAAVSGDLWAPLIDPTLTDYTWRGSRPFAYVVVGPKGKPGTTVLILQRPLADGDPAAWRGEEETVKTGARTVSLSHLAGPQNGNLVELIGHGCTRPSLEFLKNALAAQPLSEGVPGTPEVAP
ncbi:MAG: hypothetical protein FJX75_06560 [Armatimonadetes bacterium]|nr:hypothetical protein [Armatimonadota bacterium]